MRIMSDWSKDFNRCSEKVLFLCLFDPRGISTVPDNVNYVKQLSRFPIRVVNLFEAFRDDGSTKINVDGFDLIILHNSLSYDVDTLHRLDLLLSKPLHRFSGGKIIMKQDENHRFFEMASYIGKVGFDAVFTCLPEEALAQIYPHKLAGSPRFERMLTGYVTPNLRELRYPIEERPIDIGYRGSIQPLSFGRLAYEKRKIGDDVLRILPDSGLKLNISSRWEDRLGGSAWFDFLGNCKTTLGVESGASIFDLQGTLKQRCEQIVKNLGPERSDSDYCESFLSELSDLEDLINYRQISPRHFESAATRTLQIMYPGRYSDLFISGEHFIELKKDYSNLEEVLEIVRDVKLRTEIVERAYEEIVMSRDLWIESFVARLDEVIDSSLRKRGKKKKTIALTQGGSKGVVLLCGHLPELDPRIKWITDHSTSDISFYSVGVTELDTPQTKTRVGTVSKRRFDTSRVSSYFPELLKTNLGTAIIAQLSWLRSLFQMSDEELARTLDAPYFSERIAPFRWYLGHFLDTFDTLVLQLLGISGCSAIVATDLDTLLPGLFMKALRGVPVIYDAHEFWPESDPDGASFEVTFWHQLERRLVNFTDSAYTVSTGLSSLMGQLYGKKFEVLPNCSPKNQSSTSSSGTPLHVRADECRFLFQGSFAPHRGIDLLIDAWRDTPEGAHLLLRGPSNTYRTNMIKRAEEYGLLNKTVHFLNPVAEDDLVEAARSTGDVGLIPYTPKGANYTYCCPNKLSQYMAAGLPILANKTQYVESVINQAQCGLVVDFAERDQLVCRVRWLIENPADRKIMTDKAVHFFNQHFNWQKQSASFYEDVGSLISNAKEQPMIWIEPPIDVPFIIKLPRTIPEVGPLSVRYRYLKHFWHLLPVGLRHKTGPKIEKWLHVFRAGRSNHSFFESFKNNVKPLFSRGHWRVYKTDIFTASSQTKNRNIS